MFYTQPISQKSSLRLFFLILLCYGVGFISNYWFDDPVTILWYDGLFKSPYNPPDWMYTLAWMVFYGLLAFSAWLVWSIANHRYFYFQLITRLLWAYTFYVAHMLFASFLLIGALFFFLFLMYKEFRRISYFSARLIIPYMLWVLYSGYLTLYLALYN